MKNFFKKILKRIEKFDNYTSQYLKSTNNIEIPALAYTNWGLHYAEIKDYATAIEKLKIAVSMPNRNPKPCISLGILYAKLKEYENAENVLKEAIVRDANNGYTYSVLSSVLVAVNKFEEAEELLKKALKISPSESEIYLNYGILYAKMQKKPKAIEMLKKAKFYNPTNLHTYFLLGVLLFETEKIQDAFIEFKELEAQNPRYTNLNYYMALCYKKEKNYLAVLEYAQRALEETPNNPDVYILLAQNYLSLNKNNEALDTFRLGNTRKINDFEFNLAWGITLLKSDRIEEAKEKIELSLEQKPNNSNALFQLGACYKKEGNKQKAEELFKVALVENSENSSAIAELGLLYYDEQNFEEAKKLFFQAINLSSENFHLYFYVANCYYKSGKFRKSIEFYEKTLEYYPNHLEAIINYTVNLIDIGNVREALRKIRNAYQINRNSEKVLLIYALTGLKSGIYSDAIEKSDLLLEKSPNNIDAKLIKSEALINIRKPQEALNVLYSINEEQQNFAYFAYLVHCAYKILVEDSPTNYNENMRNKYWEKYNELKDSNIDKTGVSLYIYNALNNNINKD